MHRNCFSRREVLLGLASAALARGAPAPYVVAHRGGMAHRPQNTLPAFRHAVEIGVRMLEFDMNVTADDRIVLHHDTAVNPKICAASGVAPGPIRSLTLAQIRRFDCGAPAVPGTRMPTLEEFLEEFRHSSIELLGETKMETEASPTFVTPQEFIGLVEPIIRRFGVAKRFILQSGDYRTIDEMRRRNPLVRACLLGARRFRPKYIEVGREHRAGFLMLSFADVDADGVRRLHEAGFRIISSTANDAEAWRKYTEMGMDGILTDNPEGAIEFLRRLQ
jgi:glycerophosphoryl diester phosphodiesterase